MILDSVVAHGGGLTVSTCWSFDKVFGLSSKLVDAILITFPSTKLAGPCDKGHSCSL